LRNASMEVCKSATLRKTTRMETKFLRFKTPVTIGSRFGEWRVCWLGGWTTDRLSYIVMLECVNKPNQE